MGVTRLQRRYLLPIYLLVAFYLDGAISHLCEQWLYTPDHTLISRLFMLVLVVTALFYQRNANLRGMQQGLVFYTICIIRG